MTILEVANQVVAEKSAYLIRYRKDSVLAGVAQYDAKPLFTGSKRGWTMLDLTTASAVANVGKAVMESPTISDANKAKFNNWPLGKLVDFCWKQVA